MRLNLGEEVPVIIHRDNIISDYDQIIDYVERTFTGGNCAPRGWAGIPREELSAPPQRLLSQGSAASRATHLSLAPQGGHGPGHPGHLGCSPLFFLQDLVQVQPWVLRFPLGSHS